MRRFGLGERCTRSKIAAALPLDDAVQAVLERRVQNSLTTNAVLGAALARDRGWATLGDANEPWDRRDTVRGARS